MWVHWCLILFAMTIFSGPTDRNQERHCPLHALIGPPLHGGDIGPRTLVKTGTYFLMRVIAHDCYAIEHWKLFFWVNIYMLRICLCSPTLKIEKLQYGLLLVQKFCLLAYTCLHYLCNRRVCRCMQRVLLFYELKSKNILEIQHKIHAISLLENLRDIISKSICMVVAVRFRS